ncbi:MULTISPECIES: PIN domain-containing protein [Haloarcula]|uniref:PIN domain-containing protein n=1 Tax=Haloarcula TaxID=2237 RepID=UPI0023E8A832|nr:PIN domain-containing protein [Halomicroarcula sp. SHR3]
MLVLDNNLLSDYLDGKESAQAFLRGHESEPWAVSGIVLYEAYMGSVHGYIDGDVETIREAVTTSMDVLAITDRTAQEAAHVQEQLLERGVPADHPDTLIAASAREHGGTFATAEKHFWEERVQEVLDIARYDPY